MKPILLLTVSCAVLLFTSGVSADTPDIERVRSAVARAVPLLEAGSAGSAEKKKCFTCHNQALPIVALAEARRRGFEVDIENLKRQLGHTEEHLKRGRNRYLEGRGQGGKVITAGYALWALEAGDFAADKTTAAVTHYLLQEQKDKNRWSHPGNRPPSSGSDFTTTYVALRGLKTYATEEQTESVDSRIAAVRSWVLESTPRDTEDRVFRLRSLSYIDAEKETVQKAPTELVKSQHDDGGWAQTGDMSSDAYATATVLVGLLRDGHVTPDHAAVQRGVQFLLKNQQDDGSWHVVTRAKGFQTYYESGFPHGKDQFISMAASSWATIALLLTLPALTDAKTAGDARSIGP